MLKYLLSLTILLFSCHTFGATPEKSEVTIISLKETKKLIKTGAILIDNRPPHKFQKGHLPGAINLPYFKPGNPTNVMDQNKLQKVIGDHKAVIFYCTGHNRAYYASNQAIKWGFKQKIYWFKGGYTEWSKN